MDLEDFVGKKINIADLAKKLGYSRTHLSQVLQRHLPVSKKLAIALEMYTNGELKVEDLLRSNEDIEKNRIKKNVVEKSTEG